MNRTSALKLLALLLPILVLGWQSAALIHMRAYAPEYDVAVRGYDPRDMVYGKYVMLRYDWDDPRSHRPARENLPQTGRFYVPEHDAADLQTMLRETPEAFMATIGLHNNDAVINRLTIDGKPWQESLAAWRQTHQNNAQ